MLSCAASAGAQAIYPDHPVRMIVPFAAGGNADILARIVAQGLATTFKQQVIVDNHAGANGLIGSDLVAKAPADGYTLLFTASGHAINPGLYAKLPFDPLRDFAPIGLVSSTPLMIAVTSALPAQSIKALIALAKARPEALSYASQGNGSPGHLAGALFNTVNAVRIIHIPYKSTAQALTDLTSGQVQVMYPSVTAALPHVRAGRLRALAITSRTRSPLAPELPTVIESGVRDYTAVIWNGVLAPAGIAPATVARLNSALVAVVATPDNTARISGLGADPGTSTPGAFGTFIAAEIAKWGQVIRDARVQLD